MKTYLFLLSFIESTKDTGPETMVALLEYEFDLFPLHGEPINGTPKSSFAVIPTRISVSHKYYLNTTKVTWPVAQSYCRKFFDDLATVESELDWLRLKVTVASEGLTGAAWVGLYNDINSWSWSYNDIKLKNGYQNWYTTEKQPDNNNGRESCGASGPRGLWWDFFCKALLPFICYNGNNNGNIYVGNNTTMTWNKAQAYCREFYVDLAIITSEADNSRMQAIAYSQGFSWIGLYRDTWKWADGTNALNLQWYPGLPNNIYKNENCAVVGNGMFNDSICSELYSFLCHITHPVRERQIIKLQVNSDVKLLEFDVKSNILALVKQKLDENGMLKNTTVSWRVQSDGHVFHKKANEP